MHRDLIMLLNEFYNIRPLNEGGNMFPDSADITKEAAGTVLANLKKALPPELANQTFATGSAGQKPVSGDMDIMIDNAAVLNWSKQKDPKAAKAALKAALEKAGLQTALSGISVHARVPMGKEFAQVDIMLVDDAATVSKLHQHDYSAMGTTYKGKHKHFILSSAAKAVKGSKYPNGLMWSAFQGLFTRGPDGKKAEFVTNDPDTIAKMLLNPGATAKDLASPQSIVAAIPKNERAAKLAAAKIDFEKEGIPLPESEMRISEATSQDVMIDWRASPEEVMKEFANAIAKKTGKRGIIKKLGSGQFAIAGQKVYADDAETAIKEATKALRKAGFRVQHINTGSDYYAFNVGQRVSEDVDQLKGTDVAKTVKPQPFAGSQPHPFQGMLVGDETGEAENPTDKITMDVPLFLRMMEYAKEDAKTDMDLHDVTERAIKLMQEHGWLCMDNYHDLVGGEATGGEQATEGKIKGADGKACWDGYRYAGTEKGKDKCVPVKKSK